MFADYIPPGIHHFLIYCPKTHRAFVKEIALGLNQLQHMYPELPEQFDPDRKPNPNVRVFPNVWAKYQQDTPEYIEKLMEYDLYETLPCITKSPDDLAKCKSILKSKYQMLTIAFKMFLRHNLNDLHFPEINYQCFMNQIS